MSNPPSLVSIVMPSYNRADLLPDTIESILSQDFEDFELLIVDDGSTDNTPEVIKRIQEQDPRLCYLQLPENRGIGYAREVGRKEAVGKYHALADSDDIWLPGKLRYQVEIMEKYPEIDILFGDFWNVSHITGEERGGFADTQAGMRHVKVRSINEDLFLVEGGVETGILRANFIAVPTMVIRANVFAKLGGFDPALKMIQDLEFAWRASVLGARYAYTTQTLIERYVHESSVTAHKIDGAIQKIKELEGFYELCATAHRPDLLSAVKIAEERTWRKLIWTYGRNGQRLEALRAFMNSLRCGFSVRASLFIATALIGPGAISLARRVRGAM